MLAASPRIFRYINRVTCFICFNMIGWRYIFVLPFSSTPRQPHSIPSALSASQSIYNHHFPSTVCTYAKCAHSIPLPTAKKKLERKYERYYPAPSTFNSTSATSSASSLARTIHSPMAKVHHQQSFRFHPVLIHSFAPQTLASRPRPVPVHRPPSRPTLRHDAASNYSA